MKLDDAQKEQLNIGLGSADLVTDNATTDEEGGDNGWKEWAYGWVERYAAKTGRFMLEDVIAYLRKTDSYYEPHDDRAWGGITYKLSKMGIIELYGFAISRTHHATPKRVWQSKIGSSGMLDVDYEFPDYDETNTLVVAK